MQYPSAQIAFLGGIYSNYLALEAALCDIRNRGVDAIYCLGDLGAFGPFPDRVFPLLAKYEVQCIQGNYDHSVGHALDDCQCGYTDPRDNVFAQKSYDYTLAHTSDAGRAFLRSLPDKRQLDIGCHRLLLCHGSPKRVNEFLWESTTSDHYLDALLEGLKIDCVFATHTGIKWSRILRAGRQFVNVGVLGRPENAGQTGVWYTLASDRGIGLLGIEFIAVHYDHRRLAYEMAAEGLPEEFQQTILTGWWTTCLESLPSKERKKGRF
jgi:predicted phosphodiesterase